MCETRTKATRCSAATRRRSATISAATGGSRPTNGSSRTTTRFCCASTCASAARRSIPPLSSPGILLPSAERLSPTALRCAPIVAAGYGRRAARSASATFSARFRLSMSTPFWKRKPMRSRDGSAGSHAARTVAPGSVASPARCMQLYDLPEPDAPRSHTVCPERHANETVGLRNGQRSSRRSMVTVRKGFASSELEATGSGEDGRRAAAGVAAAFFGICCCFFS